MSTITVQTISNGSVSTSSANVINGSAKAWVNFNGTGTVAIRASYNVSSITDNGTGQYTVNFTTAMPDANYAPEGSADFMGGYNPNVTISDYLNGSTPSTTSCRVFVREYLGNYIDPAGCYIAIFR